jgi:hypothetical protein
MRIIYFLLAMLLLSSINLNAQFIDDMETCTFDGEIVQLNHWTDWGCGGGPGCEIVCSSEQAHSGDWSGLIPDDGTTNAILDLGNMIFGYVSISFWMYIPTGREAYWNLQGEVPVDTGEWIVGNIFFNQDLANPGIGLIDDTALGEVSFNFPPDQWFKIAMNFNILAGLPTATWNMCVNGLEVIPSGTAFTDNAGVIPTSLGGIEFFSISSNNYYYVDDFDFRHNQTIECNSPSPVTDDMESYTEGEAIYEGWWTSWGCGDQLGCALESTSAQAYSGNLSGLVPDDGTTDAVIDLGNKINGVWALEYWAFIPSNKEAFVEIKGCVPICTDDWLVYAFFNHNLDTPGEGILMNTILGDINFNFPHDQWFRVIMNVDLSNGLGAGTWQYIIDGNEVIPSGTPFRDANNFSPISLGGLEFYSISTNNEIYLDDFNYIEGVILNTNDFSEIEFSIYPNPSDNVISIVSESTIEQVNIYSIQGILIKNVSEINEIDISHLSSGLYFIEVLYEKGKSVQKFIRK